MEMPKNNIHESIEELKNIPTGSAFTNLLSVYKVVSDSVAAGYANGYDRKKSAGWNGQGADSYGVLGYTHLRLQNAINMLGYGYGHSIVHFKLLGGTKDFIFFNADQDNEIRDLLIKSYGRFMTVEEQIYTLTGDSYVARKYGSYRPQEFGKYGQSEIRKRTGKYIRGMVCDYWGSVGEVVVYPFNFGDMVACAVASGLSSSMSEQEVKKHFKGIMDANSRTVQEDFIDIVPYLECVNAVDPDGCQYTKIGKKAYTAYDSPNGPNILVIPETNDKSWHKPVFYKLFPDGVRLDGVPSNPSRSGNISFSMNKMRWGGNVAGVCPDGEEFIGQNGKPEPVFWLKDRGDTPFEWQYLEYMYQNPQWIVDYFNQTDNGIQEQLNEEFRQGMSYDDFVKRNGGIIYVCTHCYFLDGILKHGFSREYANANDFAQNGGSLTYGDGVYGTVDLDNAVNNLSQKGASTSEKPDGRKYGDVILQCSVLGGFRGCLIFDREWAERIYHDKWRIQDQVDVIVKDPYARKEIKDFINNYAGRELYDPSNDSFGRTNHVIYNMFNNASGFRKWTNFFRKNGIKGCFYHGHGDHFCCVIYDYSEVVPIAISYDFGKTWTTKGMSRTLSNGKTYTSNGIDWKTTHDRLLYAGDPANKLSAIYKNVGSFPKKVTTGGETFGCVSVEKSNGKFNCVRMDTLNEIFPVDFDTEPSVGVTGKVRFSYRGYPFIGYIFRDEAGGMAFEYNGDLYAFENLDGVIDYYIEGKYEEQDDTPDNGQLQESFFRFLDKMEGYLDD